LFCISVLWLKETDLFHQLKIKYFCSFFFWLIRRKSFGVMAWIIVIVWTWVIGRNMDCNVCSWWTYAITIFKITLLCGCVYFCIYLIDFNLTYVWCTDVTFWMKLYWRCVTIAITNLQYDAFDNDSNLLFCEMTIAVRNGECVVNTLWTSIWCKRIWHDGSVSSKIMDSFVPNCSLSSSGVHLHKPNFDALGPRWEHSTSGRKHCSLVNSCHVCLHCLVHLSDIPSISKQECHHCVLGSIFDSHSRVSIVAFDNEVPVWDSWCNDFSRLGILDSQHWSTHICHLWLVFWYMGRFLIFGIQRPLACCQDVPFSWCYVMVSFLLKWAKFFANIVGLELTWILPINNNNSFFDFKKEE